MPQFLQIDKVRTLIADYLNIDIKRVTDEAHLTKDLGADWLDLLKLMILVEKQFTGLESRVTLSIISEVVGDLIAILKAWMRRCHADISGTPDHDYPALLC